MGDFNYPDIKWRNFMGYEGGTEAGRLFIDCLDDLFLKQHVEGATRMEATLVLVISRDEEAVVDLEILDRFSTSDHTWYSSQLSTVEKNGIKNRNVLTTRGPTRIYQEGADWSELVFGVEWHGRWKLVETQEICCCSWKVGMFLWRKWGQERRRFGWLIRQQTLVRKRKRVYSKYKDPLHPAYLNGCRSSGVRTEKGEEKLWNEFGQEN